ncbi:hypothetical protein CEXT_240831 [Caerostris extrusa]|uniref:Uncharacterized protein n=1 Tax=Caerostris extrusa TaxID=172846 RepID=A0AAV4XGU7_CAEEX|nr:hypothetical protein CEXT_240831 [Caerostris extrusa]
MDRVPGTTVWVGEGTSRRCNGAWYTPTWGSPVQGSRANCTQEPPFACWDTRTHQEGLLFLQLTVSPVCAGRHAGAEDYLGLHVPWPLAPEKDRKFRGLRFFKKKIADIDILTCHYGVMSR